MRSLTSSGTRPRAAVKGPKMFARGLWHRAKGQGPEASAAPLPRSRYWVEGEGELATFSSMITVRPPHVRLTSRAPCQTRAKL